MSGRLAAAGGESCQKTGWFVHACVLMGNHYHLLLETPEANAQAVSVEQLSVVSQPGW